MLIGLTNYSRYGNYSPSPSDTYTILVPQHVVQQIPIYQSQLKTALSAKDPNAIPRIFGSEISATDATQTGAFIKTMNFLGGAAISAIDSTVAKAIDTFKSLLSVYDVCIVLKTEALEQAVLDRMSGYSFPNTDTFIDFAREIYGDTGPNKRTVDSPVGKVVKQKIAVQLVKSSSKRFGVLSTELLEIIMKNLTGWA